MKRRENGEGCYVVIQDKKSGKTRFRWVISIKDQNGNSKIKTLTSTNKAELKERVNDFLEKLKENKAGYWQNIKFTEWLNKFFERSQNSVKRKTLDYYTWITNIYLKNTPFVNRKLNEIKAPMVQEYILSLQNVKSTRYPDRYLSNSTINGIRRVMKLVFEMAKRDNLIPYNPVDSVRKLKVETKDPLQITKTDIDRLIQISNTKDYIYCNVEKSKKENKVIYVDYKWEEDPGMEYLRHQYAVLIFFAIRSMARFGELVGARWKDINFKEGSFNIVQNLQYTRSGPVMETPKTQRSRRTVLLDKKLLAVLKSWKKEQEQYAKLLGDKYRNTEKMIFTNSFGNYIDMAGFKHYYWYKLITVANFPSTRFHDLRHYAAAQLLSKGVPIAVVQERGGWSNPNVLLNTYNYAMPGLQKMAVDILEQEE